SDTFSLIIDRNGVVNLPDVGEISLSRLTFNQARALLAEQIGGKMIGVTTSITMGRLRSIRVFVLGDVRNPGSYLVSSLSTISHALFVSGGVSKNGSLRHVQLKRSGKKVAELDIYDFLLQGDSRNDERLLPGDVVFVPPVGELVAIAGEVVRPAIYERKKEQSVGDIIELSGGLLPAADKTRGQIDRMLASGGRRTIGFELTEKGLKAKVKNGDILQIHTLPDVKDDYVILSGAVKRPGRYGYRSGMHLSDLIASHADFLPQAYLKKAEVTHYTVEGGEIRRTSRSEFSIEEFLDSGKDVELRPYDEIVIRSVPEWSESIRVEIRGEVLFPGTYPVAKGETLTSLIERAGGYSEDAYLPGAVFSRQSIREQQQREQAAMTAQIEQEIAFMETRASGIRDPGLLASRQKSIAAAKQLLEKMKQIRPIGRLVVELDTLEVMKDSEFDLVLRDGDAIYLPAKPGEVLVIGQVYNTTALLYNSRLNRNDYIDMAGGPTRMADESAIYVVRASGRVEAGRRFGNKKVLPGDTIVVPEDLEQLNLLDSALDWSKVLMNVGIGIASMKTLGIL
ncbi:MAG: SLBB domain-containing protein, partial [Mariprofundaceae bacterium]|nr:SLBB domain-containing protein [Mariprofundaceae bacterium]